MSSSFEDIAIVDLDLSKTTWSRVHSAMRTLYLRLSHDPEVGWVKFFHEERESRVVLKRHGLWIEDGYIVFDCLLEDVDEHHLPDFRLSVEYANRKYRELLIERHDEGAQMRNDARVEQLELAMLRARIRAGSPPTPSAKPVVSRTTGAPPSAPPTQTAAVVAPSGARSPTQSNTAANGAKSLPDTAPRPAPARTAVPPRHAAPRIDVAAKPTVPSVSSAANGAHSLRAPTVTTGVPATTNARDGDPEPKNATPTEPAPPEATPATDIGADLDAKREEWRARFRAARASGPKEPTRGND